MSETTYRTLKRKSVSVINIQTATFGFCIVGCLLPTLGFCDLKAVESLSTNFVDSVYAYWISKILAAATGFIAIIRCYRGGASWEPLLSWGGLSALFNYMPQLVDFLAMMGRGK